MGQVGLDDRGVWDRDLLAHHYIAWSELIGYTLSSYQAGTVDWLSRTGRATGPTVTLYGPNGTVISIAEADWGMRILDVAVVKAHEVLRQRAVPCNHAPFVLGQDALSHEHMGTLPLADIEAVTLDSSYELVIRKRGLIWIKLGLGQVNNGLLLVEWLAERGVNVLVDRDAPIPPPVRHYLATIV
ncbi:MAG TPA: hypothetical protein VL326_07525, partial [Kofleriaceae bacterium]|nr:hypothetical protein [Kofleriaceae bacterium]